MKEVDFNGGIRWLKGGVFRSEPETSEDPPGHSLLEHSPPAETVLVGHVMTASPLTAVAEDTCEAALEALEEEDFHHLPVTDAAGMLVGVVSDRDLLEQPALRVEQVMTRSVLTARPETELQEASKALIEERFHCLVVVDQNACPIGILTSYDILKFLVRHPAFPLWMP